MRSGWEHVVQPERAFGALFAFTGLARALVWWIDRDQARREAAERRRRRMDERYHRLPLGYCDDW